MYFCQHQNHFSLSHLYTNRELCEMQCKFLLLAKSGTQSFIWDIVTSDEHFSHFFFHIVTRASRFGQSRLGFVLHVHCLSATAQLCAECCGDVDDFFVRRFGMRLICGMHTHTQRSRNQHTPKSMHRIRIACVSLAHSAAVLLLRLFASL